MLEYDGDIEVAAVCGTAEEAIAALPRIAPDLVTMDVELPGMGGIEAVGEIMSSRPLPILVLSGHVDPARAWRRPRWRRARSTSSRKDDLDLLDPASPAASAFRHRVMLLSRVRVIRHPRARLGTRGRSRPARRASVIGVCASIGGPQVLASLLGALPADYPIPVLVVQHIAAGFTDGLVRWLDQAVRGPRRRRSARGPGFAPESGSPLRARISRSAASGRLSSTGALSPGITAHLVTSFSPASPQRPGRRAWRWC